MDISTIEIGYIESCAYFYEQATECFGTDPVSASAETLQKTRKWLERNFIPVDMRRKDLSEYLGKQVSDKDFFEFLEACYNRLSSINETRKETFEQNASKLNDNVKDAVFGLIEYDHYCKPFSENGKDIHFIIEETASFRRVLTLVDADPLPKSKFDCIVCKTLLFDEPSNRYQLVSVLENWEDDTTKDCTIAFSDARIDTTVTNALSTLSLCSAWDIVTHAASDILQKHSLPGDYCNEQEKAVLPILADLCSLTPWAYISEEFEASDFSVLRKLLTKYNYTKPLNIIEKINNTTHEKKRDRLTNKLLALLKRQQYEPLWREIYNLISASQCGYPDAVPVLCNKEILHETREKIQKRMEAHGYSGNYPDFMKKGSITGLHSVTSGFSSYIVGMEKNVVFHIHFSEVLQNEEIAIEIFCGTEILRKDETSGDIYSCMFEADGRRLINTIYFVVYDRDDPLSYLSNDPIDFVDIAVKKAEIKKLTKFEREKANMQKFPLLKMFLFCLFGAGFAFGILMTIYMILLAFVINLFAGVEQPFTSLFGDGFWVKSFLFSSLGFGGLFGIFMVFAFRK